MSPDVAGCLEHSARNVMTVATLSAETPASPDPAEAVYQRLILLEKNLSAEHLRLLQVIDGLNAGTWEWNPNTGELRFNERWAEIVGYTLAELGPTSIQTWIDFAHPDDLAISTPLMDAHLAGERDHYECHIRMRHRDGHWVWFLDRGRIISRLPDGRPEWLFGVHIEITQLVEVTDELRRVKDFLDRTGTVAGVGGWEIDAATRRVTWSEAARRIHEVGPAFVPDIDAMVDFYSPEARATMKRAIEDGLTSGRGWDLELPFITAHDRNLWVRAVGTAERDGDRVVRLVGAVQDITERKMLEHDLRRRARHDALTGLLNRGTFEVALAEAYTRRAHDGLAWLLAVDLDGFKLINDGCGHAIGDRVLRDVAVVLQRCAHEHDVVARVGGDEFSILLGRYTRAEAIAVSELIGHELSRLDFSFEGRLYRVGASMGLVPIGLDFDGPDQLSAAADSCCRAAKSSGKNGVRVWRPEDDAVTSEEPRWAQRIEWALAHMGFRLYAQRLVKLVDGDQALRCEVLPRLVENDGNLILPQAFLDAAERFRFAARIDLAVLEGVLVALKAGARPPKGSLISLNLSAQLLSDRSSQAALHDRLSAAPAWAAGFIAFELDEDTALASPVAAVTLARDLQALGARFALDNFGGGANSINRLRDLKPDMLKLDNRLVRALPTDPMAQALTRGLRDVARVLKVPLVAKGIESARMLEAATALGLDLGQGFFLHEPEPLEGLLVKRRTRAQTSPPRPA